MIVIGGGGYGGIDVAGGRGGEGEWWRCAAWLVVGLSGKVIDTSCNSVAG